MMVKIIHKETYVLFELVESWLKFTIFSFFLPQKMVKNIVKWFLKTYRKVNTWVEN